MDKKIIEKLKVQAVKGSEKAYSPYSRIKVGAAVLTENNEVFNGGNIENISFGGTICAERVALCKAVNEGNLKIKALFLYTKEQWTPCGICLQFMSEFMDPDATVFIGDNNSILKMKFKDLLPRKVDIETFSKLKS